MLSKYKKVDSGGIFLNNIGFRVSNKFEFLSNYKFSICFENKQNIGYCTEKLVQVFLQGTIPIYFGDNSIVNIFNTKSYVHILKKRNFSKAIKLIETIYKDETLYNEIL